MITSSVVKIFAIMLYHVLVERNKIIVEKSESCRTSIGIQNMHQCNKFMNLVNIDQKFQIHTKNLIRKFCNFCDYLLDVFFPKKCHNSKIIWKLHKFVAIKK